MLASPYYKTEVQYNLTNNEIINIIFRNNYRQLKIQFVLAMVLWIIFSEKIEIKVAFALIACGALYWTFIEYLI